LRRLAAPFETDSGYPTSDFVCRPSVDFPLRYSVPIDSGQQRIPVFRFRDTVARFWHLPDAGSGDHDAFDRLS
jgi:hypothetical protein